jgi:hypothetical protein
MALRAALVVLVLVGLGALFLWSFADPPAEEHATQDIESTSVDPNASYRWVDPETGRALLVQGKHLPKDYRPPPSSGPCDEEARKTMDNWRRLMPYVVVGLGLVLGATAIFLFVDTS